MRISEYLKEKFPFELKKMCFIPIPDDCIKCLSNNPCGQGIDEYTIFFGGNEWENFYKDIKNIDKENLEYFFVCLFTIITIDVGLYTYYKEYYNQFREKTRYPKFGWYNKGFGISPFFINPYKLIQVPESNGLLNKESLSKYIDEYINLFILECNEFFKNNETSIKTNEFIKKILNDDQFFKKANEDSAFALIYNKLKEKIK
jgi:hypothetical protein